MVKFYCPHIIDSVTRWLHYSSKFCSQQQWIFAQKHKMLIQIFYQTLNKPIKVCKRVLTFCQSGEISSDLVTQASVGLIWPHLVKRFFPRNIRERFIIIIRCFSLISSYDICSAILNQDLGFHHLLCSHSAKNAWKTKKINKLFFLQMGLFFFIFVLSTQLTDDNVH